MASKQDGAGTADGIVDSATSILAGYLAQCSYEALTTTVVEQARLLVLDVLGVALLGWRTSAGRALARAIASSIDGRPTIAFLLRSPLSGRYAGGIRRSSWDSTSSSI